MQQNNPRPTISLKEGEEKSLFLKRLCNLLGKHQKTSILREVIALQKSGATLEQIIDFCSPEVDIKNPLVREVSDSSPTILEFMIQLKTHIPWFSVEHRGKKPTLMSNSEMRRIIESGNLWVNGTVAHCADPLPTPIISIVMFPHSPTVKNTVY